MDTSEGYTKQQNDVLNFWCIGYSGGQIAQETGLTKRRVYRIVQTAQEHGDDRAAPHRPWRECNE